MKRDAGEPQICITIKFYMISSILKIKFLAYQSDLYSAALVWLHENTAVKAPDYFNFVNFRIEKSVQNCRPDSDWPTNEFIAGRHPTQKRWKNNSEK